MKKILGLDLGTNSIGWALVKEAENENEKSEIIKLGVRVNPLTVDEQQNFEKGKSITTNADRTLKRSMRRNLQRYKLRRENLIDILKENGFISDETILSENGNFTTFETYRLRAKAATEEITLEQFARVLLMINKKRGYKSSRKAKGTEDGGLIDGMEVAKRLYDENLTPGQLSLQLINEGKKYLPDFYRSDLQTELDKIWTKQQEFYPEILTDELREELKGKKRDAVYAICVKRFVWKEMHIIWNNDKGINEKVEKEHTIVGFKRNGNTQEQKFENLVWRTKGLTDGLHSYRGINKHYNHQVVIHSKGNYVNEEGYHTNGIEGFWSHLKRGLKSTYHSVSHKHLQKYCNEFAYKYSTRKMTDIEKFMKFIASGHVKLNYSKITYPM